MTISEAVSMTISEAVIRPIVRLSTTLSVRQSSGL